jgi:hypothetical protein
MISLSEFQLFVLKHQYDRLVLMGIPKESLAHLSYDDLEKERHENNIAIIEEKIAEEKQMKRSGAMNCAVC